MATTLEIRPITYTEVDDKGFLGVQVQLPGPDGQNASHLAQTLSPYGYFAVPLDPVKDANGNLDAGQASQGLCVWQGDELFVIPCADPRAMANMPNLTKGDVGFAASAGTFVKANASGTVTRYTTDDGTTSGQSIYDQVHSGGRRFISPLGTMKHDVNGYHLTTWGGARFDMGSIGGLAAPASAFSTYASLKAATISLRAARVSAGGAFAAPVTAAVAIANFLDAFITALVGAGGAPVTGGAVGLALTAALAATAATSASGAPLLNPAALPIYEVISTRNFIAS